MKAKGTNTEATNQIFPTVQNFYCEISLSQDKSIYVIAPHPCFLFDSSRAEKGFNDTGLIVFSALVQYVGSICRIKEALEQHWKLYVSIYSYEMSNVLEVRPFSIHRCADMITAGLLQDNP